MLTWTVPNGGRLCTCDHIRAVHVEGKGACAECDRRYKTTVIQERCHELLPEEEREAERWARG
jgi:hypothetical protein